ncbi:MAG TPA: pitrilysin family protein [Rhodothermales bacterium]|nr:pitrilysin family protein [Rhodothermales bacterium]
MFVHRIKTLKTENATIFALPTSVREVVSWYGSFYSFPEGNYPDPMLLQELMVAMLDKGTLYRDKFLISDELESRGAQLQLFSDGLRIGFFGRALKTDLPAVLGVLGEQLNAPQFDPGEFEKLRLQTISARQRSLSNTRYRAELALNHALYPDNHPNYNTSAEQEIALLEDMKLEQIRAYHQKHVSANQLIISTAGDVDPDGFASMVDQVFLGWKVENRTSTFATLGNINPGKTVTALKDRQNLDVMMGIPIPVTTLHPDYLALYLATYILGGNFSARLMNTVRDEQGLTYGIGASLSGVTQEYAGYFQIYVTLSQENLGKGITATEEQLRKWVQEGITESELAEKKTTIAGKYQVEMATTHGLARAMQQNAEEGYALDMLDDYVPKIEALTADEVNRVIRKYINPEDIHLSIAGTLPE